MTALLTVEDLSLGFATEAGFASVLDRVSLSIERGQVLGLVGESGCGKTTLARAILGVLPRTAPSDRVCQHVSVVRVEQRLEVVGVMRHAYP